MKKYTWGIICAGALAGAANGLFGGGGGMVLVPALSLCTDLREQEIFPASVCIIMPVCMISLLLSLHPIPWRETLCYLAGSGIGGILAGLFGKKIPTIWLHRGLGLLIIWGGIRYLW